MPSAATRCTSLIDACETQRTTLLALIEADAAGFLPLQKAYAIPRTDPDRAAKLAAAAQTACLAPLAMLEHCAQTALLLTAALETASPSCARTPAAPPCAARRGGGCGHERICQHRPAHAGRAHRDRGARRASARDRGAKLHTDRGRGVCRAARGGLSDGNTSDRRAGRK
ncbi:MAG: cyclodeaminase/cyclohydrolase family protein [Oscillospiraceae bacterium]